MITEGDSQGIGSTIEIVSYGVIEVRDGEVVMRGMDHKESAQELMEAMRIYHNYIKPHQRVRPKGTSRS